MPSPLARRLLLLGLPLWLAACASPAPETPVLSPDEAQLKIRAAQTRQFDVADREQAVRGVIAALQDLGFIIERANGELGLVTAARFAEPRYFDVMGITVTVRPKGAGRMEIRANAVFNNEPVTDPAVYQSFFATLERSLFIGRE